MKVYDCDKLNYDEMEAEHVRDGGISLRAVVDVISRHYGLPAAFIQRGTSAITHLFSPTKRTVAVFALRYDGRRWILERAVWQEAQFRDDWLAARQVVRDFQ